MYVVCLMCKRAFICTALCTCCVVSEVLETVALSADHMGEARAVVSIAYDSNVEPSARVGRERERGARHFA